MNRRRFLQGTIFAAGKKSLPLVEASFEWAREVSPSQPLTVGLWANFEDAMHLRFVELSDVLSFHAYDPPEGVRKKIEWLSRFKRPILCMGFLRRQLGNTFAALLPIFFQHKVGWYFWGLVAGKTQTYLHWSFKTRRPTTENLAARLVTSRRNAL